MKKGNLIEGVLFVFGGVVLLLAELLTDSALDSLLIGLAAGAVLSGIVALYHHLLKKYEQPNRLHVFRA